MNRRGFLAGVATAIISSRMLPQAVKRKALFFRDGPATYMYIQAESALQRGSFVSWVDPEAYLVRPTFPAKAYSIAGVACQNISAGNFGFIQVSGSTSVTVRHNT